MRSLVAAIVGVGFIGPVHLEALRRIGVPVKGVLGSSPDKSRSAARSLGLEVGYESFDQLTADADVTVLHLASPNRVHREQTLAALKAGKHVICEKPLGMTSAETADLVRAEAQHPHLVCAVNYNIRFYPVMLHLRSLIQKGDFGRIFHVTGSYMQDWLLLPTDFNWRVLAEEGGALRAVGDVGTHWLDLAQFVTGLGIEEVLADLCTVHPTRFQPVGNIDTFSGKKQQPATQGQPVAITTDDHASVLLRFQGGARGAMTVSQVAAGRKNCVRLEISGEKASASWNSERPDELWLGYRSEPNRLLLRDPSLMEPDAAAYSGYPAGHAEGFPDCFKQLYRSVYRDIAAGRRTSEPLYATFGDGHRELIVCEAIAESHRRGSWVRLADLARNA